MRQPTITKRTLAQRLLSLAFLNKGLTIRLTGERVDPIKTTSSLQRQCAEFIKH